jgi:tetratricopeptide (TPR) repeat protein
VRGRWWAVAAIMAVGAVPTLAEAQRDPVAQVRALRNAGRYAEAIAAARRTDLAPQLGELLRLTGQWDEAERVLVDARARGRPDSLLVILQLALLREERGQRDAAFRDFDLFIDVYNADRERLTSPELAAVATAVERLSVRDYKLARDALRAYDEAIAADSGNLEARLALGELFLSRYNGTDARATFEAALERDSLQARALIGLARTARFSGSGGVTDLIDRSLSINPHLVDARVFLAELLSEVDDYDGARRELAAALEVNPRSLRALATRAAVDWLVGDTTGFEASRQAVLTLNPRYASFYHTVADLVGRHRLYDDAAAFARQGVALDTLAWQVYGLLGINELRLGSMDSGRLHLERAFAGDPFDVWTKNTLDLLDTLDTFPVRRSDHFRVVADPGEIDVLAPYALPLAAEAYASMSKRYGVTLDRPTRVELFRRHADFSVRTMGLVGLGALGVSFGPVIAMDAPSARPTGDFNWGSTLWHELAHSFHMVVSKDHVPRWFTEGLAVYEERLARPGWGDDVTPSFLTAYKTKRLLPVSELNDGFVRPAYPEQLGFSYVEASLVCEMIAQQKGFATLVALLRSFGDRRDTPAAFRSVLGVDMATFEGQFTGWLEARFATQLGAISEHPSGVAGSVSPVAIADRARKNPGDFRAQLAMGQLLAKDGRHAEAEPYLERAKALFPEYAEADGPYSLLAAGARARGDLRRAAAELTAMTAINERSYDARVALADVRLALGDSAGAADALDQAMYVDPTSPGLHQRLADLAEALHRPSLAVREWRALVALDPADPAVAYYRLAQAELAAGDREAARRAVLRALEQAPGYEPALELLLEIKEGRE